MDPKIRFMNKVTQTPDCWLWNKGTAQGYGRFSLQGVNRLAHQVIYEWTNGAVPTGLELDHTCRVRACVNPNHLEAVTHAENVRRGNGGMPPRLRCPQGHAYEGDNVYHRPDGKGRGCKACRVRKR